MSLDIKGHLALVGGAEWRDGCSFDKELIEATGIKKIHVLPTAAAYQKPDIAVKNALRWFETLGVEVVPVMVLGRQDAFDNAYIKLLSDARFVYLSGGSPLHVKSVLMKSPIFDRLKDILSNEEAVVAASSASAMALGDPMLDPRGGAYTIGLGLVRNLSIIPHFSTTHAHMIQRSLSFAPKGVFIAGIDEQTALIRFPGNVWRVQGMGQVKIYKDGEEKSLSELSAGL